MGESFPMNGGDGALSYAKNSHYQKESSDSAKGMIEEAVIHSLDAEKLLSFSTTLRIADLGCSVGPNTFSTVQHLIESLQTKLSSSSSEKKLEYQVFFNDHSTNDFNTLFASLPPPPERQYYAAGVPGSFHARLFPSNSINIAYSSYALQWLSKKPEGLLNEGRIHYTGAPEDVVVAYSDQFSRDLGAFMRARADEIVSGGLLFLIMPGIPQGMSRPDFPGGFFDFLGNSLMDLAHEGVVEKAKIDEFNLPLYAPTAGEMRGAVEENGCFSIERLELRNPRPNDVAVAVDVATLIAHLRAGTEGAFAAHFGSSVVEKMFTKVSERAQDISQLLESSSASHNRPNQLFLVLKRR